jgi:hypothetical protein
MMMLTSKYGIDLKNIQSINCRLVDLKGIKRCQFNYKYATNEKVKNYNIPEEATSVLSDILLLLSTEAHTLRKVVLTCKTEISELQVSSTGNFKLKTTKNGIDKSKALKSLPPIIEHDSSSSSNSNELLLYSHDRPKNLFVPMDSPFLKQLKIVCDDGVTIKSGMSDKFKQIQKYVEIMNGLVQAVARAPGDSSGGEATSALPPLSVVDMGSGLGYLTFAMHAYFTGQGREIKTVGVEIRPDLVSQTNNIAKELGSSFEQLSFVAGSIQSVDTQKLLSVVQPSVKVLIALHACDTATDDAILEGLKAESDIIVIAPCCQKEVRGQIDKKFKLKSSSSLSVIGEGVPEERVALHAMMTSGLHRERLTEMATDQLRTLLLQHEGYDARISEFVDRSHTAKNVLISAVRKPKVITLDAKEAIKHEIDAIMKSFGITKHSLYDKIFFNR